MSAIPIRRHIKIKAEANPYDPAWKEYLKELDGKTAENQAVDERRSAMAKTKWTLSDVLNPS